METGEAAQAGTSHGATLPPGVKPEDLAYPLPEGYALPAEARGAAPRFPAKVVAAIAVVAAVGVLGAVLAFVWPRPGAGAARRARILLERGVALHAQQGRRTALGMPGGAALARALNLAAPDTGVARTVPFAVARKHQGLDPPRSRSGGVQPARSPEPLVAQCLCDGTHRSDVFFYRYGADRRFTVLMAPRSPELLRALRTLLRDRNEPRLVEGVKTLALVYGHASPMLALALTRP